MASRKPNLSDLNYLDRKMGIIKMQMDSIEEHLANHQWEDIEDPDARQKEFKLQRELTEGLMQWSEQYTELCGIMDVYRKMESMKGGKALRSGQQVSGIQEFVKAYSQAQGEIAKSNAEKKSK